MLNSVTHVFEELFQMPAIGAARCYIVCNMFLFFFFVTLDLAVCFVVRSELGLIGRIGYSDGCGLSSTDLDTCL